MKHDPFFKKIIEALSSQLDPNVFELCCVDLVGQAMRLSVVPITGGTDSGMDGAIADGEREAFPLVVTSGQKVISNLEDNLDTYVSKGKKQRKAIFCTSQALTTRKREKLLESAAERGFTLVQVFDQEALAMLLYRNPKWCRDLLHLSGTPSALSVVPKTSRPQLTDKLIGRDEVVAWMRDADGDRLLVGEPGCGKTSILLHHVRDESQRAFFLVDEDRTEIANAIRELSPTQIFLDDADSYLITQIRHLRTQINAEFRIVATCWNGDKDSIAHALNITGSSIFTLNRLTQDQMVEVIEAGGIKGVDWLLQEIILQSEGLPGLASTLVFSALKGGVAQIRSAEALETAVMNSYERRLEKGDKTVLACFCVGGKAGMSKKAVAIELGLTLPALREVLRQLAAGGVIAEVARDSIKVRPDALRHALLRDVFFSGPASLPIDALEALIQQSPDRIATTRDLLFVRFRGGNVSEQLLRELVADFPTVSELWELYAYLRPQQATWVLENYQGSISNLAPGILDSNPVEAIPRLLSEAVGDNRPLNSHPEHPLRRLQDWIKSSYPTTSEAIQKRRTLFQSSRQWLLEKNDLDIAMKSMTSALYPMFEITSTSPGSGNSVMISSGYLTVEEIHQLELLWVELIDMTDESPLMNWQPIFELIRTWAYPFLPLTSEEGRASQQALRSFAGKMVLDVAGRLKGIGTLCEFRDLVKPFMPELKFEIDRDVEIIYPYNDPALDWQQNQKQWNLQIEALADEWKSLAPDIVVDRLVEIETHMSGSQGSRFPRLTSDLCHRIAEQSDDCLSWVLAFQPTELSGDLLFPFIRKAVVQRAVGWNGALQLCLDNPPFETATAHVILTMDSPPEDLKRIAIERCSRFPGSVGFWWMRNELSTETMLELLQHSDKQLVGHLATTEWQCDPVGIVRDRLRPLWEQAVVNCCEDDYWLAEIFAVETHLAFDWLKSRLSNHEQFWRMSYDRRLPAAINALTVEQRKHILDTLPTDFASFRTVALLVGSDITLYRYLLELKHLDRFHLTPLASHDLNQVWQDKALLAHEAGYSSAEIVACTVYEYDVVSWTGKESAMWEGWVRRFESLLTNPNIDLREIAQEGQGFCFTNQKKLLEREYHEDVYGRDA